ncbi:MAG: OmpH family outer membrane protein [Motiliproteus sp.]
MKSLKLLLTLVLMLPMVATAENIAVLDVEGAIRSSKQVQVLRAQLTEQFAGDQKRLKSLADEGNTLKQKMEKEGDFLSEDERKTLVLQIQQKFQAFQQLKGDLQKESQKQERAFLEQLRPKVEEILKVIVEKNKIDLIFNKRALVYTQPQMDLTAQVIEELNKQ